MEVAYHLESNMNVNVVLSVEIVAPLVLSVLLRHGPLKLITLASMMACSLFQIALNKGLPPFLGLLLFSVWLIGSVGQLCSLLAVGIKSECSQNHITCLTCLLGANTANGWLMYRYFDAIV